MALFTPYTFDILNYITNFLSLYDAQNLRLTSKYFLSPQLLLNSVFTGKGRVPLHLQVSKEKVMKYLNQNSIVFFRNESGHPVSLDDEEIEVALRVDPFRYSEIINHPSLIKNDTNSMFYRIAQEYPVKGIKPKRRATLFYCPSPIYHTDYDKYVPKYAKDKKTIERFTKFSYSKYRSYFSDEKVEIISADQIDKSSLFKVGSDYYSELVIYNYSPKLIKDRISVLVAYSDQSLSRIAWVIKTISKEDPKSFRDLLKNVFLVSENSTSYPLRNSKNCNIERPPSLILMKWYYGGLKNGFRFKELYNTILRIIKLNSEEDLKRCLCPSFFDLDHERNAYTVHIAEVREVIRELEKE